MITLLLVLGLASMNLLAMAATLWLFGKPLKYHRPTLLRAVLVVAIISAVSVTLSILQFAIPAGGRVVYALIAFPAELAVSFAVLKRVFRTTTLGAWAGVGSVFGAGAFYLALVLLCVRPFFAEAFITSTFGDAPTLRSPYHLLKCPRCGGPLLVEVPSFPRLRSEPAPTSYTGLCADCLHITEVPAAQVTGPIHPADRFLVAKFLTPRRWDIVTFRTPGGEIWVKRVVGLPNETIAITSGGKLLINGKPAGAPPDLPRLAFTWPANFDDQGEQALRPDAPLRLGPDEFFVIGDNVERSYDSRFFGPIHRADLRGVVNCIYWPPDRFRLFP